MAIFYLLPRFNYYKPKSLNEALKLLNDLENSKVLAGGTDLVLDMKIGRYKPENVIDISHLNELKYIKDDGKSIRIGAGTTLQTILESNIVRKKIPVLAEALEIMGSWQLRNVATIGGNLCNASPAADTAPPLMVLEAQLKLESIEGARYVPITKFFHGPRITELKRNELLTEIIIPYPPSNAGMKFLKLGRRAAHTLSIVAVATLITIKDDKFDIVRIALNSVAPTPLRAYKTEESLKDKPINLNVIEENVKRVAEEIKPISDVRASAEYRKEMSIVLTRDAILESLKMLNVKIGGEEF
ncbi:MAG: xanthine dehydrogenase family protein subunit M [Thermoprotei archaeon]|nr:MAG: xanthine dehydrogenase family protein subunit M [Thermoprotei archaeon]